MAAEQPSHESSTKDHISTSVIETPSTDCEDRTMSLQVVFIPYKPTPSFLDGNVKDTGSCAKMKRELNDVSGVTLRSDKQHILPKTDKNLGGKRFSASEI